MANIGRLLAAQPALEPPHPYTDEEGALIYVKVGHLGATLLIPDAQ